MLRLGVSRVAGARFAATQRRCLHASGIRQMAAAEEAGESTKVLLNFSAPEKAVISNEKVDLVNIPGMTGEYGVAGSMAATISEMRAGTVTVTKAEGGETESYFVPAGVAITSEDSTTNISACDIASLDELDLSVAQANFNEAKQKLSSLEEGSQEHAVAQIEHDVYEAVCIALGANV
mmetsp:Transcript_17910/g.29071  ORF Transcript_17910/g.29071 Transcript_17910/m.29071 type:complete len:178 (-) Transcript_17910:55-588(-)|eukprot:CAMPEP_0203745908 /NCGR_PEP_ID=MMETSP0098-20131031/1481_1 /ASSEMBLY_ACC=CAM_ASM_000208 /TAXON_ID=96639 /ORGANISM=" , Strain NY0313808BC1" /LENGTH=177 /DNA_ID=CAMNT_0050633821 /DNA_START=174 /DNA_END=707 /DNA_ORIENTATION=+